VIKCFAKYAKTQSENATFTPTPWAKVAYSLLLLMPKWLDKFDMKAVLMVIELSELFVSHLTTVTRK